MKKRGLICLIALCLVVSAFLFVACGDDSGTGSGTDNSGTGGNEAGDAVVSCAHTFGDWIEEQPATCGTDGVRKRTCSKCRESETDAVPATGKHTYGQWQQDDEERHSRQPVCGCNVAAQVQEHRFDEENNCLDCGAVRFAPTEGLAFGKNKDNVSYAVTGIGTATDTNIVIPAVYEGLPVTSIGANAFKNNTKIKSVYIPNSVQSIGESAFENCAVLAKVDIQENGVKTIGQGAFCDCVRLESFIIPDGVTTIKGLTFLRCKMMTEITLPLSLKSIYGYNFDEDPALAKVSYAGDLTDWCQIYFETDGSNPLAYAQDFYVNGALLTDLTIPDGLTKVQSFSFAGYKRITRVVIPRGVTEIGGGAFYNCGNITDVSIPDTVTNIKYSAFQGCGKLESIVLPDTVGKIGTHAFKDCIRLQAVNIPNSVSILDEYLFEGCVVLPYIELPRSVQQVKTNAFDKCTALERVSVHASNPYFAAQDGILYNKEKTQIIYVPLGIRSATISDKAEKIEYGLFTNRKKLESLTIPDSVTDISYGAFYGCSMLIQIEDGVSYVDTWAIGCDSSVTNVMLRYGTKRIVSGVFSGHRNLTSIMIPDTMVCIEDRAFSGCGALENVKFQSTGQSHLQSIGQEAFVNCTALQSISVPNSVQSIGKRAFADCTSLTNVGLSGLGSIGDYAFSGCTSLLGCHIPANTKSIGAYAFAGCTNLEIGIDGASILESIGTGAFQATAIVVLTIPVTVTAIGEDIFADSSKLVRIDCKATSKPDGWAENWCGAYADIVNWGGQV